MKRANRIGAWCGVVIGVLTIIGMVWGGYNRAPVPESVKTFHTEAMAPMQQQMNRSEGKITALTIPPLVEIVCANPNNKPMRELLLERVDEYSELLGRTYTLPDDLDNCDRGGP